MSYLLVTGMAFAAVGMDLLTEKIPNMAIIIFIMCGVVYRLLTSGAAGCWWYLRGAAIPLLTLFFLFVFRMLGPGDIKLLAALGGIMGPAAIIKCMIFSFLFGAFLSAALLAVCKSLGQRLRYFTAYITLFIKTKKIRPYYKPGAQVENIHFSVPIFMSVLLYAGGFY